MSQQRARVSILVHNSGKKAQVQLPVNVSVGSLLPHLIRDLQLPTEGEGETPIRYTLSLENEEGPIHLKDEDILAEVGVRDGSALRIALCLKAGEKEDFGKVTIIDILHNNSLSIIIPFKVTARRLLPYLLEQLKYPGSHVDRYRLVLETGTGREKLLIGENQILTDAGVGSESILLIIPASSSVDENDIPPSSEIIPIVITEHISGRTAVEQVALSWPVSLLLSYLIQKFRLINTGCYLTKDVGVHRSPLPEGQTLKAAGICSLQLLHLFPKISSTDHAERDFDPAGATQQEGHYAWEGTWEGKSYYGPFEFAQKDVCLKWKYLDFDIQLSKADNGYQAEVLQSPAGYAKELFAPPDKLDVENFILRMKHGSRRFRSITSSRWEPAKDFGIDLFQRLFVGKILSILGASMAIAEERSCGLRIKLRLDQHPELMVIPWEFLYNPARKMFLAPQEDLPIVRFLGGDRPRVAVFEPPLHILVMIASPSELEPLNIAVECQKLEQALHSHIERGLVALEWVEGGTMDNLHNYLTQSKVQHNVFHFVGHGGFDRDDNQGFLAFADPNGRIDRVGGERLGPLLAIGRRRFQLVVLNACEGARNSLEDPFSAVATSLLCQTGIPAAVAMQFEISDDAAIAFSSRFYAALAHGRPVDTAVTNARLAIYATHSDVEWATPVLYMRTPDGHLFNLE